MSETVRITGMDLTGYMCVDAKRAIAFYRAVLGLEPDVLYPQDRGAEYTLPDGSTFGLWGAGNPQIAFQPSNGVLFAVDDLEASLDTLKTLGVPVTLNIETPNCRMAMFKDTEGNTVTLHRRNVA